MRPGSRRNGARMLGSFFVSRGLSLRVDATLLLCGCLVPVSSVVWSARGVWCVVCGVWCVVCGVWCVVARRALQLEKSTPAATFVTASHSVLLGRDPFSDPRRSVVFAEKRGYGSGATQWPFALGQQTPIVHEAPTTPGRFAARRKPPPLFEDASTRRSWEAGARRGHSSPPSPRWAPPRGVSCPRRSAGIPWAHAPWQASTSGCG